MRKLILFPAFLTLVFLTAGCDRAVRSRPEPEDPIEVRSTAVRLETGEEQTEVSGTVHSLASAALTARVMGEVLQVAVQEGDRVNRGQVLVRLDDRESRAAVAKLDAAAREVNLMRDEVSSSIQAVRSSAAQAESALALAEATFQRFERLVQKEAVSQQEFDEVRARRDGARAAFEAAQANLQGVLTRQPQLDARAAQIEADRSSALTRLQFSEVLAPFSGVVLERHVDPGDLASPAAPLLVLEKPQYRLEVNIDESLLSQVHLGDRVEAGIAAVAGTLTGTVSQIAPGADPRTRTTLVKIDLPDHPDLRSGQFGRIQLSGGSRSILTIPSRALVQRGQLEGAFVIQDGRASFRVLRLGRSLSPDRTLVSSGLSENDQVIVDPSPEIRDGTQVKVVEGDPREQPS